MRGNIVELSVAVVLGGAFNAIVSSIVDNILMPIVGILMGGKNFDGLIYMVGESSIKYGVAITAVVKFIIVAFFLFMVLKAVNKMNKKEEAAAPAPEISSTDRILGEILQQLKK
jgi:large conductance mechanosensitive channel